MASRYKGLFHIVIAVALSCLLLSRSNAQEVRFLVDESASMADTDPQKLRVPALEMIMHLLPNGSRAGIFSFSNRFNVLLGVGKVDEQWRKRAKAALKRLNTNGQYTRLDQAILKATRPWLNTPAKQERILILVTDGKIDVSDNTGRNVKSTLELLDKIIPTLKKNRIKVYAIGLSNNINKKLLKRLSQHTGGSFQITRNSTTMEKTFYRVFNEAIKTNEINITKSSFKIDKTVNQLTLVFPNSKREDIKIVEPTGQYYDLQKANVFKSNDYMIVTIMKPMIGRWHIDGIGESDDMKAIVLSDIDLSVNHFKHNLLAGEQTIVYAYLTNHDHRVLDNKIISNTDINFQIGKEEPIILNKPNPLEVNYRKVFYIPKNLQGEVPITFTATSETFKRVKKQTINIEKFPFDISLRKKNKFDILLHISNLSSNISEVDIKGKIDFPISKRDLEFIKYRHRKYYTKFSIDCTNDKYKITLFIGGKKIDGTPFHFRPITYEQRCRTKTALISQIEPITNNNLVAKFPELEKEELRQRTKYQKAIRSYINSSLVLLGLIFLSGSVVIILNIKKRSKVRKIINRFVPGEPENDDNNEDDGGDDKS